MTTPLMSAWSAQFLVNRNHNSSSDDLDMDTSPTDRDYCCPVCKEPCLPVAQTQQKQSIGCSNSACECWYHFGCVGLTGTEPACVRPNVKWNCPTCREKKEEGNTSRGRGRGRGRGKGRGKGK
eukprot:GHVU01176528.1.p1 GENE.GHVU01176528.1~~GHVU01176528.1.p1  ORF type:complete len:137 (+),score=8.66 GHVU01176528.1:44-412(+)